MIRNKQLTFEKLESLFPGGEIPDDQVSNTILKIEVELDICAAHASNYVRDWRSMKAAERRSSIFMKTFAAVLDIDPKFVDASNHPGECKCDVCLEWWARMPDPEPGDGYGPFTEAQVKAKRLEIGA